jgi:hypothetical protein
MNNSFLEILKDAIQQDIVCITYKQREAVFYTKFFIKANDKKFYNTKTKCFQLVTHIDNKLETIQACDIVKFKSCEQANSDIIKNDFRLLAEEIKADYEKLLPNADTIEDFNDYFFNENINLPSALGWAVALQINQMKHFGITDFEGWMDDRLSVLQLQQMCNAYYDMLTQSKKDAIEKLNVEKKEFIEIADAESVEEIDIIISMIQEASANIVEFMPNTDLTVSQLVNDMRKQWPPILLPVPF